MVLKRHDFDATDDIDGRARQEADYSLMRVK